jgi:hypothetical protein
MTSLRRPHNRLTGALIEWIGLASLAIAARSFKTLLERIEATIDGAKFVTGTSRAPRINDGSVASRDGGHEKRKRDARHEPHRRGPPPVMLSTPAAA